MPKARIYKARLGRKLKGKPLDLAQVLLMLSYALRRTKTILDRVTDDDATLRAIHCMSQVAGQYAKLLEVGELESRIVALESAQKVSNL